MDKHHILTPEINSKDNSQSEKRCYELISSANAKPWSMVVVVIVVAVLNRKMLVIANNSRI